MSIPGLFLTLCIASAVGLVASVAAVIMALICVGLCLSNSLGDGSGASLCFFVHNLLLGLGSLGLGLLSLLLTVIILLGLTSAMIAGTVVLIAALFLLLRLIFLFGLSCGRLIVMILLVLIVFLMLLLGLVFLLGSLGLFGTVLRVLRLLASMTAASAMTVTAALMLILLLCRLGFFRLIVDKGGSRIDMSEVEAGADALGNFLGNLLRRLGLLIYSTYGETKLTGLICLQLGNALLSQFYLNGAAQQVDFLYGALTIGSIYLGIHLGNGFEQMLVSLLLILQAAHKSAAGTGNFGGIK